MKRPGKLRRSERSVAAVLKQWQALVADGRAEDATRLCKDALKRFPDDVRLLLAAASGTTDIQETQALVRRAVALAPTDPEALAWAATSMFHSHELAEASEYLDRAAALVPAGWEHEGDLLYVGGRIAAVREDTARAEAMLRAAYLAQPELPNRGAAYAEILAIVGRCEEALEVARDSLTRFPDDEWLLRLQRDLLDTLGADSSG
jgi:hypothetical protein